MAKKDKPSKEEIAEAKKDLNVDDFDSSARSESYENYSGGEGEKILTGTDPEIVSDGDLPDSEKEAEESDEAEYVKEEAVESDEKPKTVPHEALHEERELHKATKTELAQMREENKVLLADLKELITQQVDKPKEEESPQYDPDDYTDPQTLELRKEIDELKALLKGVSTEQRVEKSKQQQQDFDNRMSRLNKRLVDEGAPGFEHFIPVVYNLALTKSQKGDKSVDTEDGWAKIYREELLPKILEIAGEVNKVVSMKTKLERKKKAHTVSKAGRGDVAPKSDESWSFEDYVKMRESRIF